MEEKMNVSLKFFDDALVQRVIDFTELSDDKKTKENINALTEEIKNLYSAKTHLNNQQQINYLHLVQSTFAFF